MRLAVCLLAGLLALAACGPLKILPPAERGAPRKQATGPPLPPAPGVTVLAHEPVPLDETLIAAAKSKPAPSDGGARELGRPERESRRPEAPPVPQPRDLVALAPPAPPEPDAGPHARGRYLFALHCATCHGVGGAGDGPSGAALLYPPSDLTRIAERRGGVFRAADIAAHLDGRVAHPSHGPPDAPIWGPGFVPAGAADADLHALLVHLEALQRPAPEPAPEDAADDGTDPEGPAGGEPSSVPDAAPPAASRS